MRGAVRHWLHRLAVAASLSAVALVVVVEAVAATSREAAAAPSIVAGAVSCPQGASYAGSFVVDAPVDGLTANGWIRISNATETQFDWAFTSVGVANVDMAVVVVQGGGQSAIYTYDYLTNGWDNAGTGLKAPGTASITKVEFCFDDKGLREIVNDPGSSGGSGSGSGSGGGGGGGSGGGSGGGGGGGADLAVTGIVMPPVVNVGDTITWRFNVVDKNEQPATGLNVMLELAGPITFAEAKTDRGSGCKAQTATAINCHLDYLSKASPIGSIVLLTKAAAAGDYSVTARASFSAPDVQPADNTLVLKASSSQSGVIAIKGKRLPSSATRFLVGTGKALKGKVRGKTVVFTTTVRLRGPARLVAAARDTKAKKRLTLLPGSRLGDARRKTAGPSVTRRVGKAGKVATVVVVRRSALVRGRAYRLVVDGIAADGRGQKVTFPLRW